MAVLPATSRPQSRALSPKNPPAFPNSTLGAGVKIPNKTPYTCLYTYPKNSATGAEQTPSKTLQSNGSRGGPAECMCQRVIKTRVPQCTSRRDIPRENFVRRFLTLRAEGFGARQKIRSGNPPSKATPPNRVQNPSRKSVPKIRPENPSRKSVPKIRPENPSRKSSLKIRPKNSL